MSFCLPADDGDAAAGGGQDDHPAGVGHQDGGTRVLGVAVDLLQRQGGGGEGIEDFQDTLVDHQEPAFQGFLRSPPRADQKENTKLKKYHLKKTLSEIIKVNVTYSKIIDFLFFNIIPPFICFLFLLGVPLE